MSGYMQDVPVRNRELLAKLNAYKDLLMDDVSSFQDNFYLQCKQDASNRHYWAGDRHMQEILEQGDRHEGFPDSVYGYELGVHRKDHEFYSETAKPSFKKEMNSRLGFMNQDLINWLGVRNNALTAYYPPGGFISWHNNANASAYNLIFTWSEKGQGCFKYIDPETKEVVIMEDKPGWQCKAAYFGHYGEPERLFYHAAQTDCWRVTVSFIFDRSDMSEQLREDLLEDIMTE